MTHPPDYDGRLPEAVPHTPPATAASPRPTALGEPAKRRGVSL